MKKIIVLLTAMLMLASCSNGTTENVIPQDITEAETTAVTNVEDPDFRNVKWGMSKENVIAAEGTPNSDIDGSSNIDSEPGETGESFCRLVYNDVSVTDYTAELNYFFENNSLTIAEYRFDCSDKTDLEINSMYLALHNKYIEKYGNPISSRFMMSNLDYQELEEPPYVTDSEFSFGDMASYKDEWSNINGASISMSMMYTDIEGTDKLITFGIVYKAVSSDI